MVLFYVMNKSAEIDEIIRRYSMTLRLSYEKLRHLDETPEKAYIEGSYFSFWRGLGGYEYHEASVRTAKKEIDGDIRFSKERIRFFEDLKSSKVRRFITRTKNEMKHSDVFLAQVRRTFEKYRCPIPSTNITIKLHA